MLKLVKKLTKKQVVLIFVSVIFVALQVYLDLRIPDFMNDITKRVSISGGKIEDVLIPGSYMLLCAFGSLLSSVIVGYFAAYIAASVTRNLREDIFKKVTSFGMNEIKGFSTSSLITRTTNDVNQVGTLIAMGLQVMIKAPILAVWAISKIHGKSIQWGMATVIAVVFLVFNMLILFFFALPRFNKLQKYTDNLNRITRENLTGLRVVRAFNAEAYQNRRFNTANKKLTDTNLYVSQLLAIASPVMALIMSGLSLAIYFIGAYLINDADPLEKITIFSDMVVFSAYAIQVVMAFVMMGVVFVIYPRAAVSAKRINEVLDTKNTIKYGTVTDGLTVGEVEFKNVSFKYPDAEEYMLRNVSFKAEKGQTVAFIGATGSGKSTVINLIPRFYDATEGEVFVDGINVKEYEESSLYDKIGYISQKAILFKGSIKDNISYGLKNNKKVSLAKVKEAIKVSQSEEFVSKLPKTYNYSLSEAGSNVSGGQKQRISIARAIARNPEIYIFDDSFSALDYKTDLKLRKELKNYTKDATVIIVAQRIGTIKDADKIFVIDEGKIVGEGTHKSLLKTCKVYKEIVLSQVTEEEIKNA